jgi:hypothetical protein
MPSEASLLHCLGLCACYLAVAAVARPYPLDQQSHMAISTRFDARVAGAAEISWQMEISI